MSDAPSLPAKPSQSSELVSTETDYKQLTDALMQTQRGRRFLAEHARRCRQTQQADLLAALARLERAIAVDRESPEMAKLRCDFAVLTRAVERIRTEILALRSADRRGPQDEEITRLLREQNTRLDALADFWTHARGPASPMPASAPQPAAETSRANGAVKIAPEPREKTAVPAQNGAADGPAGAPYGAETPASDLLRQTPIFDLAFDSTVATEEATADAVAASETASEPTDPAESAEHHPLPGGLDEPAARFAIVRDGIEQGGEEAGESSERHPDKEDDLPGPADRFAIAWDRIDQDGEEAGESSERHPDKEDDLPGPADRFAIAWDRIDQDGKEAGESSEHGPPKPELVRPTESHCLSASEVASDSAETAFARDDEIVGPELQSHTPEVPVAETPAASIAAEPPTAALTAESPPGPVADEPSSTADAACGSSASAAACGSSTSAAACHSPTAIAAAGDPLAPLYALSEEERIALFT